MTNPVKAQKIEIDPLPIFYIFSLVLLGVLLVFTVFRPMAPGGKYSTVSQQSIIQTEGRWVIQLDIINREGEDASYIITWASGDESYSEKVSIKDGRTFTYIHYVYPEQVKEGKVNLEIYKEGESIPFEQATYYVRFD